MLVELWCCGELRGSTESYTTPEPQDIIAYQGDEYVILTVTAEVGCTLKLTVTPLEPLGH